LDVMREMKMRWIGSIAWSVSLCMAALPACAQNSAAATGPVQLRVDNLKTPLGIDDSVPSFSWQLHDLAHGARQTAYDVTVASTEALLQSGKADVWSSGKISSGESLNIRYGGPALKPETRYYWRVKLWGAAARPYAASEIGWWETGLMNQDAWRAGWIGYETQEEAAVKHASAVWIASPDAKALAGEKGPEERITYRTTVMLVKPVRFAEFFATAQDTVSAWIDGQQALKAAPLPPWSQMPWKKFVRADVTGKVKQGANSIAVEAVHYTVNPNGMVEAEAPPMIATLVVEYRDGTWGSFASNTDWKTAIHAPEGWQQTTFDDAGWKHAVTWNQATGSNADQELGHPWIADSVKALRHDFSVESPIKSARLYATALGMYEIFLNGRRVGDQVMSPGWTDYRQRVVYQTYDVTPLVREGKNATGWLPLSKAEAANYTIDGVSLAASKLAKAVTRAGQSGFELPAGSYAFSVAM
jgi:alpha-L-rhamnosidase